MRKSTIAIMFSLGVLLGVIFVIAGQASAAPMGDGDMPERIPFTNKPVVAGDPESYIGTYGQCPFYENAMEKGCYPPSDIECNADWSYCQPRTASVTPAPTSNATNTQPPAQTASSAQKTGNAGYSGAGSSTSYATTDANEPTNVNETTESVDVAHDDVNKIAGIPADNVEQVKNDTRADMTTEIIIGGIALLIVGVGIWIWRKKPFNK